MRVIRGRDEGQPTARDSDEWFTGDVWLDPVIPAGGHEAIHCRNHHESPRGDRWGGAMDGSSQRGGVRSVLRSACLVPLLSSSGQSAFGQSPVRHG